MLPIKQNFLDRILVGIPDFRHSKKDLALREYFISKHIYIYLLLHICYVYMLLLYYYCQILYVLIFHTRLKQIHSNFLKSDIFEKGSNL